MMRRLASTILIAVLMLEPMAVAASEENTPEAPSAPAVALQATAEQAPVQNDVGTPTREMLAGNGGAEGYVLAHKSIVPGSDWVYVGMKRVRRNVDYTVDCAAGSITFKQPVPANESIKVEYNYIENGLAADTKSLTTLELPFAGGLRINPTYTTSAIDSGLGSDSVRLATYGLNSSLKFGSASALSGMMYMTTPQDTRVSDAQKSPLRSLSAQPDTKKMASDRMMLQDADLGMGKVRLRLGYQDVGENFAGFNSLRENKAAPDATLNMLEKEKGIKRLDIAADMPVSGIAGFNFAFGRISDKTDEIINQVFGFASDNFAINFGMREVGKDFGRFKDLREADRGQLAAEAGMKRTNYGMQFAGPGSSQSTPVWNSINVSRVEGENGSLTSKSADLDLGSVKLQADIRTADPKFDRMAALNDQERTRMALAARRQFSPSATANDVTAADKKHFNNEIGLDRANYLAQWDAGSFKTWMSLSSVDSQTGGLNRTAINIEGNRFNVFFKHHSIDKSFDRLQALQPIERQRFGNEYGMSRTAMGGAFKIGLGQLQMDHSSVHDDEGATMVRQSIDLKAPGLKFHANFQDISSNFQRILDLSDEDRKLLLEERGFKKSDYAINFQATKALNIDSYIYDSSNLTAGQTRDQQRHAITYTPGKGPQVTALHDNRQYVSESGNLSSYKREKITFDNQINLLGGLMFKSLNDTYTSWEGDGEPIITETTQTHIESDQGANTSFSVDTLNVKHGNDRFENVRSLGVKTKLSGNLSMFGAVDLIETDKEDDSGTFGAFGFDWAISKDLKMTANITNVGRGQQSGNKVRQFSLNGMLAKRFLFLNDIVIGSGMNSTALRGKQTRCDNAFKMGAGVMGGNIEFDNTDKLNPANGIYYTSRLFKYESDKDPAKWYHFKYFRQNLITPQGNPARKRDYAVDLRLAKGIDFTYSEYFGRDGKNGAVSPVGGTVMRLTRTLPNAMKIAGDYTIDLNEITNVRARTVGLGVTGTAFGKHPFEIYYGWSHLCDNGVFDHTNVFRVQFDHKVDDNHFITLTAVKKSGVDKTEINPNEGRATARVDFKTVY